MLTVPRFWPIHIHVATSFIHIRMRILWASGLFVRKAGIRDGEGVVLIMSTDHCEPIKLRLQIEGFNVAAYERSGQLTCITSEDLLAKFMVDES